MVNVVARDVRATTPPSSPSVPKSILLQRNSEEALRRSLSLSSNNPNQHREKINFATSMAVGVHVLKELLGTDDFYDTEVEKIIIDQKKLVALLKKGHGHGFGKSAIELPSLLDKNSFNEWILFSEKFNHTNPYKAQLCLALALTVPEITLTESISCLKKLKNALFPDSTMGKVKQFVNSDLSTYLSGAMSEHETQAAQKKHVTINEAAPVSPIFKTPTKKNHSHRNRKNKPSVNDPLLHKKQIEASLWRAIGIVVGYFALVVTVVGIPVAIYYAYKALEGEAEQAQSHEMTKSKSTRPIRIATDAALQSYQVPSSKRLLTSDAITHHKRMKVVR